MITYPQFKAKYCTKGSEKNPATKNYWTTAEIAAAEGMTVEQIQAYGNYFYSQEVGTMPDFTPKPVVDPVEPVEDHTGMEEVQTPFGPKWRPKKPKLVSELTVEEFEAILDLHCGCKL